MGCIIQPASPERPGNTNDTLFPSARATPTTRSSAREIPTTCSSARATRTTHVCCRYSAQTVSLESGKSHEVAPVFRYARLTAAQPNIFSTQPFSICLHVSAAQKERHGQDDTGDADLATRWAARERTRHQGGKRTTQIPHLIDDDTHLL
jgi:hypothetical protein